MLTFKNMGTPTLYTKQPYINDSAKCSSLCILTARIYYFSKLSKNTLVQKGIVFIQPTYRLQRFASYSANFFSPTKEQLMSKDKLSNPENLRKNANIQSHLKTPAFFFFFLRLLLFKKAYCKLESSPMISIESRVKI